MKPGRTFRFVVALALACLGLPDPGRALDQPVRIGVLSDMSGPFSDQVGAGSVAAARLALEDFARESGGLKVELLSADHQNKPDIGLGIARRWLDQENVAAIVDLPNSGVALAVANLMRERNRVALASSAMTSDLTGKFCAPTTVQWVSDTWAQGSATARALAERGAQQWYFLTVDYALGHALERDATRALVGAGGRSTGGSRLPLGTGDFSSALLTAQSAGAQVLALANTGADMINAIKQAGEFGLTPKMKVAALFIQLSDTHSLGLATAQGLQLVSAFYWDRDERTRAFGERFGALMNGRRPTEDHAGVYSATLAYLRAVRDAGTVEGDRVVGTMRKAPIDDPLFGTVTIRPDGRAVHDMYLYEVKPPSESKRPYDYYKLVTTIAGDQAFRSMKDGDCQIKQ
ncbi:amino acid/amide ABC transporter substrate-binding protein, HAAT family (TC 3.A.1.4.-) [Methylobacterium sp. ap11]|uniref:ABC transporter substrate-binding protein n=1 Tax=Methylobacterium sp. ap11 TaxID=1761799 RepID=UPI0008BA66AB|nr:ABC transporter substrate-binding protein [Methylobacterium sp. ap11]SEP50154.1 amino acid/amide ABC transporter substrate-binding protein, HAAT family (TC 3.A.1.4.-) [Methylobacterium sp. ap11]